MHSNIAIAYIQGREKRFVCFARIIFANYQCIMKGKTIEEVCSRKSLLSNSNLDIFQVLISLIFIPKKLINNHSVKIYKYWSFEVFGI